MAASLSLGHPADGWSLWPAPAKLNLFLHIVGRRDDGYHELQTAFQLLDWGDTIHIRVRENGEIRRLGENSGIEPADDLAIRAARLLQVCADARLGAEIRVEKRIPLGGGMGGGSSNAASVLVALNQLWGCGFSTPQLAGLGLELGADVPVFVQGRSAFAEGVGERLTPLDLPERDFLLLNPATSISTGALFQAPELTRDSPPLTIAGLLSGAATGNAFEPIVRARYPAVARAMDWLAQFGNPRLTGTGSVVFADVQAPPSASRLAACPEGMRAWCVRGVNVSPLLNTLKDHARQES